MSAPRHEPVSGTQLPLIPLFAAAAALLVVVGSMGPWARVLFISVNGTDGDGAITLVLGILAGLLAVVRLARPAMRGVMFVAGLAFLGAAAVGVWGDGRPRQSCLQRCG